MLRFFVLDKTVHPYKVFFFLLLLLFMLFWLLTIIHHLVDIFLASKEFIQFIWLGLWYWLFGRWCITEIKIIVIEFKIIKLLVKIIILETFFKDNLQLRRFAILLFEKLLKFSKKWISHKIKSIKLLELLKLRRKRR